MHLIVLTDQACKSPRAHTSLLTLALAIAAVGAMPALVRGASPGGVESTPRTFGTPGDAVRLEWAYTAPGAGTGYNGLEVADLTGNGQRRVVASTMAGYWQILRSVAGSYVQEWASEYYAGGIRSLQVMNVDADPLPEVLVALDSRILVYEGNPPRLEREIPAPGVRGFFAVADVDDDGNLELVYGGDPVGAYYARTLYVVDLATGAVEYTGPGMGGIDLAVGNVDADPGLEIVVTGVVDYYGITQPGYVLDGKTRTIEWTRPEGFGRVLRLGDLDGDGRSEIVAALAWYEIRVIDAVLRSEVASIATRIDIDTLLLTDIEGDGPLEIVYSDYQGGTVHVLNGQSRAQKWEITAPGSGAGSQLAAGDADDDGINEIVWCGGYWSTRGDYLFVADTASRSLEWQSVDLQPPFSFTSGDFDADGAIEVLSASASSDEGYEGGYLLLHDGSTHRLEAQGLLDHGFGASVSQVRRANVDADPQDEFFVNANSRLACHDGLTRAVQWHTSPSENGGWFSAFDLGDVDGDGAPDLVGIADGKVYVFDALTGVLKWKSPAMTTGWNTPFLRLANIDDDARAEIIVGPTYVYGGPLPPSGAPLYVLDAVAGTLQSVSVLPFSALELFDADGDGRHEVLLGDESGNVWLTGLDGAAPRLLTALGAPRVNALRVADLDGQPGLEILVVRANELSIHSIDGALLWRSGPIDWGRDYSIGQYDHVHVGDFDADGHPDFVVGIGWGFRVYEVQVLSDIRVSVNDVVVSEGNGGTIARFDVTLSAPSTVPLKVAYATRSGTAVSGSDFEAVFGFLTFSPGVTSQPVDVPISGDRLYEDDETFELRLTGLGDAVGHGTIMNDDPPGLTVSTVHVREPETGTAPARFEVVLSPALATPVSVDYVAEAGTATAPDDYLPTSGRLTFAPGEGVKPVLVDVLADDITEEVETFTLKLANAQGADIVEGSGQGWLIDWSESLFFTLAPCRLFDSRSGPPLAASDSMSIRASGLCGVPAGTRALAINVTVVAPTAAGHIVVTEEGDSPTGTSTLNFGPGQTRANNAIIPLGPSGSLRVFSGQASGATHVVLDVTGYFR